MDRMIRRWLCISAMDESARNTLPFSDLRNEGLLWLINRVVFHPRGFALGLSWPKEAYQEDGSVVGEPDGWMLLGDGMEVWAMDTDEDELFNKSEAFIDQFRFRSMHG